MDEKDIKKYWDCVTTESMYDKNLLEIEVQAVLEHLEKKDTVIDIGCGEGEATAKYYKKVKKIVALDYSSTRLEKLKHLNKDIETILIDMRDISVAKFKRKFDKVITQRSLINLRDFEEQREVIRRIHSILADGGTYIMLEGFNDGADRINKMRIEFNLLPVEMKWHNYFFDKGKLLEFSKPYFHLEYTRDFSIYFFMTRIVNAILKYPDTPKWNDPLNNLAKKMEIKYRSSFLKDLSRLKLLVFRKI